MKLLSLWLAVCLLATGTLAARTRRQSGGCRDHEGRSGTCTTLQECPALNALRAGGLSRSEVRDLQAAAAGCGRRGRQQLVCCAQETPTSPPATPASFTGNPEDHPNRAIVERGFGCGNNVFSRIVGGTEVPLAKYPWVALLGYTRPGNSNIEFHCGGSLISQQYVLTAAHCVSQAMIGEFTLASVRLGEHRIGETPDCQRQNDGRQLCNDPQDFGIAGSTIHEGYNEQDRNDRLNDIALIKLDRPVSEDNFVSKICLPFGEAVTRDYSSLNLTVAGFGRTGPNSPSSAVLLEIELPGVQQSSCEATVRAGGAQLTSNQFCAGGQVGRDSCGGDSGGPVVLPAFSGPPYTLVGIISFGETNCGGGNVPSVNTRVSSFLNWVLDRVDA